MFAPFVSPDAAEEASKAPPLPRQELRLQSLRAPLRVAPATAFSMRAEFKVPGRDITASPDAVVPASSTHAIVRPALGDTCFGGRFALAFAEPTKEAGQDTDAPTAAEELESGLPQFSRGWLWRRVRWLLGDGF